MPEVKPGKILSFSSEDNLYPASNLLKCSSTYQWKCKVSSDKQSYVEFQFSPSSSFNRIEIGNSGSAFIEIYVSHEPLADISGELILPSTSLMTPSESIKCEGMNKVRCFNEQHFMKSTLSEKWNYVKVLCSQPFNKSVNYGLSFIRFFTNEENADSTNTKVETRIDISKLISNNSDDSSEILPGSLFSRRNELLIPTVVNQKTLSMQVTAIKPMINQVKPVSSEHKSNKPAPEIRKSVTTETNSKLTKNRNGNNDQSCVIKKSNESGNKQQSRSMIDDGSRNTPSTSSNIPLSTTPVKTDDSRMFLSEVTFAMSGYENPLRNQLRTKAVSLGAHYEANWSDRCTHLICAFPNTPKFKEVSGKGIIVSGKWIDDCFLQKKHLSWRHYRVKGAPSPPMPSKSNDALKQNPSPSPSAPKKRKVIEESDENTDDEIDRVLNKKKDDSPASDDKRRPDLPILFENIHFFFYGTFKPTEHRQLKRLILTFGGFLHDYMDPAVGFVITSSDWDENFDMALKENGKLKFVKPEWIYLCDSKRNLESYEEFEIRSKQ